MNLHDFNLLLDVITGLYAVAFLLAPFKVNGWIIGALLLNALLGLIAV